jgi:LacI family repressor for deo operon, udp, cdd, tsx, nupC, and nupG
MTSAVKAVTGHDVARRAGVSQSTVSLVLSGKAAGRVSPPIQARVREAAAQLHYVPNAAARALRGRASSAIGMVVPDVTNSFLGRVVRGCQGRAREAGYTVVLQEPVGNLAWQLSSLELLQRTAVDGWLLFAVEPLGAADTDAVGPIVAVDARHPGVPSVVLDVAGGTDAAMAHLLELGHLRIAHLAADIDAWTFRVRGERWGTALDAAGAVRGAEARTPFSLADARAAAHRLISDSSARPSAIFCDDDLLAAGVYLAAAELGLSVPGDLSVVGFAGTLAGDILVPALTTVVAPAERLGETAMEVMLARLEGDPTPDRVELPVRLEVRASTSPVEPASGQPRRRSGTEGVRRD